MHRTLIAPSLVLAFLLAGGCQQWDKMRGKDDAKMERTSMTALPASVRESFERDFPKAVVSNVSKETEKNGAIHYEIKFTDQSGRKQTIEYDAAGKRVHESD
jgi:YD repeat-containing protein